ncbi:MAG: hypothetical protein IKJ30_02490 [Bacilli bacterium]|nr:hypothetical protein [Bacilli bacterium]
MVSYEGIFFDGEAVDFIHSLEENRLERVNNILHCTFKYKPSDKEIFDDIVGKNFDIYIVGYGNDGMNSGFEVVLPSELMKYYINFDENNPDVIKIPHITASLSEGAKAVNTKNLIFKRLEKPIKITGRFGYWIKEDGKEFLSYEPYKRKNKR